MKYNNFEYLKYNRKNDIFSHHSSIECQEDKRHFIKEGYIEYKLKLNNI